MYVLFNSVCLIKTEILYHKDLIIKTSQTAI